MRRGAAILAAALWAGAGLAQASECGEQIRLLDDRYSLALTRPTDGRTDTPAPPSADQTTSSGAGGAPRTSAGMDTVPNTGGLANPRNTPVQPLGAVQRERVRQALMVSKPAHEAGGGAP